jgi:hypothetical protein
MIWTNLYRYFPSLLPLKSPSVVVDTNRQGRQSSILVDITVSIYIDSCPLFIKSFPNLYRLLMFRYWSLIRDIIFVIFIEAHSD